MPELNEAVIVASKRSAVGKAPRGALRHTRPDDMGAEVLRATMASIQGFEPSMVEDIAIGCAMPEAEQGLNVGRMIGIGAGCPVQTAALTVNRFCSSGLQTIAMVAERMTGQGVFLSNVIDRSGTPLLALAIARTLSESFAAVDLWIADHDAGDGTNVVVAAWKDGAVAFRPAAQGVTATVMAAGGAAHPQRVVWRRIDVKARTRRWPHACAALLTDDWTPVDRLLAGRPVC